jgi:protocatechuate 3,4-dioxygenase beta subunit
MQEQILSDPSQLKISHKEILHMHRSTLAICLIMLISACSAANPTLPAQTKTHQTQTALQPKPNAVSSSPEPVQAKPQASASPLAFCLDHVIHTNQVKGQITDQHQKPLAGVSLSLSYLDKALPANLVKDNPPGCPEQKEPLPQSVTSDANGNYLFEAVVIGPKVQLSLSKAGFNPLTDSFVVSQVKDPEAINLNKPLYFPHLRDFQMSPDCPFSSIETAVFAGQITDTNGKPVAQSKIQLSMLASDREQNPSTQCNTVKYEFEGTGDDKGEYLISGLTPARYTATISHPNYKQIQEVVFVSLSKTGDVERKVFQLKP